MVEPGCNTSPLIDGAAATMRDQRDHYIRLFNRLDAAISHHKKNIGPFASDADDALHAARDRILRDAAQRPGDR